MTAAPAVPADVAAAIRACAARHIAENPPPTPTPEQVALLRRIFARPRIRREAA